MRRFLYSLVVTAAICPLHSVSAQTPTYAPSNPLVAPGEPLNNPNNNGSTIPTTPAITVPSTTPPSSTVPQNYNPNLPAPVYPYQNQSLYPGTVPSGNSFDPPATVVTPGTVAPTTWGAWYPGYWMGYRPGDPPYGGGPRRYQSGYQGIVAPYGAGGCNTCQPAPSPCGPTNLDFGRGYDGFMTGW